MNLHLTILLFLVFSAVCAFSQAQSRGIKPVDDTQSFSGSTKLVVVGVSKYQNVPSLNYAHTDAQAFYNFMTSPTGGRIDQANARILLNEEATAANIWAAIYGLLDSLKEGETVIIYFAGHGDLERKTISQLGYLLATDAPKVMYPVCGTVPVYLLQEYLSTLVQANKARIILITDACHSGKLAGGLEGVANTATSLQSQWANTIKILSSQPGELSQEGTQWNGGGGVFTYFLVKGLMGFADRNRDGRITMQEINIYLTESVPKETNFSQYPSVTGDQKAILAVYDTIAFESIKNNEQKIVIDNKLVAQRGFEDEYKKTLDSAVYKEYQNFRYCIENHFLIDTIPDYGCAWDIYQKLKNDKRADPVINNMKYSLLAALQSNYQHIINLFINSSSFMEVYNVFDENLKSKASNEIEKALELVDSTYILYGHLKASCIICKCLTFDEKRFNTQILSDIDKAIHIEPDNAFFYLYRGGILLSYAEEYNEAIRDFEKGLELAPNCNIALVLLGHSYRNLTDYDKAITYYEKAIKKDSLFIPVYLGLASIYGNNLNQKERCIYYLNRIDSIASKNKMPDYMLRLGGIYKNFNDTAKAIYYYEKANSIDSTHSYDLGELYFSINQPQKAKICFQNEISRLKMEIKQSPTERDNYYGMTRCYSMLNMIGDALKSLELYLLQFKIDLEKMDESENGLKNRILSFIEQDKGFNNIRKTKEFKALIKKYLK